MTRKLLLFSLMAAFALSACAPKSEEDAEPQPDVAVPTQPNSLRYSSGIPRAQSAALDEAISALYVFPISYSNTEKPRLIDLMKTKDVSPKGLQSWMQARVQYIIEENFSFETYGSTSDSPYVYQNADVLPDGYAAQKASTRDESPKVMMANIGAAAYVMGKKAKVLLNLNVPGIGSFSMTSPRTGLLQIGEGLFMGSGQKRQNIVDDIFRAGILFHEARHSDGRGKTLGFLHAKCLSGDYTGRLACDYSTNGPYTIGSTVMLALLKECRDTGKCTARSNAVLKAMYIDQASRTIRSFEAPSTLSKETRAGVAWDDAPEGVR